MDDMANQGNIETAPTHTRVEDPLGNSLSTLVHRYPLTRARGRLLDVFYPTNNDEGLSLLTISLYSVQGDVAYRYPMTRGRWTEIMNPWNNDNEEEQSAVAENSADQDVQADALSSIITDLSRRGVTVKRIVANKKVKKAARTKRARKLAEAKKRKRDPNSGEIYCFHCDSNYEILSKSGSGLFSSNCGHLYCSDCLKSTQTCFVCKRKIAQLWQIYL